MLQENKDNASRIPATPVFFRHADGIVPNTLAIAYVFIGYGFTLYLLTQTGWVFCAGIILLAHNLIIAAYLQHECIHGTLFKQNSFPQHGFQQHDFRQSSRKKMDCHSLLAACLSWVTGSCYTDFAKIKNKHLRHHFERADIVSLDYRKLLDRHAVLRKAVLVGQYVCLPAVELLMHALVILRPFGSSGTSQQRQRVLFAGMVRVIFFSLLAILAGWQILFGYALAYLIFLSVLNFMDAFQHQYLMLEGLELDRGSSPARDRGRFPQDYFNRDYENGHTFSNLISQRWPWLNLLVLNFVYHNVHHQQPMQPWYRLAKLHQQVQVEDEKSIQIIPLTSQLKAFVRYRSDRVMTSASDNLRLDNLGAAGVSFLTPI